MAKIRWGILGPGSIAHKFATGLKVLEDAELTAVASRSLNRAEEFAGKYDIPNYYQDYEELVNDPEVDVIYIATPHNFHKEHTILCLEAGKHVLCEKPMAINAKQEKEMIETVRKNQVFLMEAMWTRFLPVMVKVKEWLNESRIGKVKLMTADFGFRTGWNPENRLLNLELAGGALLDVGIYVLSMAWMVYGQKPATIKTLTDLGETGVDEQSAILLGYDEGQMAMLSCAVRTNTPQEARIMGTEGSIYIPDFWHAESVTLRVGDEEEKRELEFKGNGYNYEALEVMRCLEEGKLESEIMPLAESLEIASTMDQIRANWGLTYPDEG